MAGKVVETGDWRMRWGRKGATLIFGCHYFMGFWEWMPKMGELLFFLLRALRPHEHSWFGEGHLDGRVTIAVSG